MKKTDKDKAAELLFKGNPKAHALHKEGKKLAREKARVIWFQTNGPAKDQAE